jgi:hypothetical protein
MRIIYLINGLNGGGAAFPMLQVIGLMRELGPDVEVLPIFRWKFWEGLLPTTCARRKPSFTISAPDAQA